MFVDNRFLGTASLLAQSPDRVAGGLDGPGHCTEEEPEEGSVAHLRLQISVSDNGMGDLVYFTEGWME